MYLFFKKGMRRRAYYISRRCSSARNKYLKFYNQKQESKDIIYLEASNLYGYAMSKFLPTSEFKWIDPESLYSNKYSNNSSRGCVLEIDLGYPKKLRELHNDYPFGPDKIEIKKESIKESSYQLRNSDFYIPIDSNKKLVPNFLDKERYVLHYEKLQLYLRLGLKLKEYTTY